MKDRRSGGERLISARLWRILDESTDRDVRVRCLNTIGSTSKVTETPGARQHNHPPQGGKGEKGEATTLKVEKGRRRPRDPSEVRPKGGIKRKGSTHLSPD